MVTGLTLLLLALLVLAYLQGAPFGSLPKGERLDRIRRSPNYREGQFQNLSHTPSLTEGYTLPRVIYEFLFKNERTKIPPRPIPSVKTDLRQLPREQDVLVWFGHSSYFLQLGGKRFLVDPVLSGHASPLPNSNKAFAGTDIYQVEEIPDIDFLLLTHDHYDHLDYSTMLRLRPRVGQVYCGLGTGAHLERWGFEAARIEEMDWDESAEPAPGFVLSATPARHFSGRSFRRNRSLWLSFVLQTPSLKLFIGGDSGYDTHFAAIGTEHGPFDLAILENGQYDRKWKYIHALPEEVLQAGRDLYARRVFPVHSGKFAMAAHPWDEPLRRISAAHTEESIPLITPMIGQLVDLHNPAVFTRWWEDLA